MEKKKKNTVYPKLTYKESLSAVGISTNKHLWKKKAFMTFSVKNASKLGSKYITHT